MYTIQKTDIFDKWLSKLRDLKGKARILTRIKRAEFGNLGDYKALGNGLFEMRIDTGPGYRLYYTQVIDKIIILLSGGSKSSQVKDIKKGTQDFRRNWSLKWQ
jgi:putative addiction module killer protein